MLEDPDLVAAIDASGAQGDLVEALGRVASPDGALLCLTRVVAAAREGAAFDTVTAALGGPERERLLAVLGASTALGDHLVRHPDDVGALVGDMSVALDPDVLRAELLSAVGAPTDRESAPAPVATVTGDTGVDAMRRAYRRRLLTIAAVDLTSADPLAVLPDVAAALADLAAAALEAALALARAEIGDEAGTTRLAVIGMGKCGSRELNYVSDVDVIYVAEPADGVAEADALAAATRLATTVARICSGPSGEPALWPVDAALRPEGKNGPLVRTVASHTTYYRRWAKTWEFQALLKARVVAGDLEVGQAYITAVEPNAD